MTSAHDKNRQAFASILGDANLAVHLSGRRVGIVSDAASNSVSGHLLAAALGDTLGRLWPAIDATGPLTDALLDASAAAAASGAFVPQPSNGWSPPYDIVVAIGQAEVADNAGPVFRIGANDWSVTAGKHAVVGDSPNPAGPAAGAALASAEIFKYMFQVPLAAYEPTFLEDVNWNVWTMGRPVQIPVDRNLILPRAHCFGVGAVAHGLLWVLERWPGNVSGELLLIDHDAYDRTNGQRYAGMQVGNVGESKAVAAAERLRSAHKGLDAKPYVEHMNDYFDKFEVVPSVALAIVGLDSAESRRHAALKLPRRAVNMWTERQFLGAARFGLQDGWPCMMCSYPEALTGTRDEVAVVMEQTTLPPFRVRKLLDTGEGLTPDDAKLVGAKIGGASEEIVGKPLRTVLQQLCATGKVVLPGASTEVDVPFAFSSLLAGVVGFAHLTAELWTSGHSPFRWAYNTFKQPNANIAVASAPRLDCLVCADHA